MAYAGHDHMEGVTDGCMRRRSAAQIRSITLPMAGWIARQHGFVTVTYFNSLLADETVTDEFGLT
jgi:hypothetical protein